MPDFTSGDIQIANASDALSSLQSSETTTPAFDAPGTPSIMKMGSADFPALIPSRVKLLPESDDDEERLSLCFSHEAFAAATAPRPAVDGEAALISTILGAIEGGRRGRKINDPSNQRKRKAESELSTNPHTRKAAKRLGQMGPLARQLANAEAADHSAVSKARRKMKESATYQAMTEAEQSAALIAIKKKTLERRHLVGYSKEILKQRALQQASLLLGVENLADEAAALAAATDVADAKFTAEQKNLGKTDDDEVFWSDDDTERDEDLHKMEEDCADIGEGVLRRLCEELVLWKFAETLVAPVDLQALTPEAALEESRLRQWEVSKVMYNHRAMSGITKLSRAGLAWDAFLRMWHSRFARLKLKEDELRWLGQAYVWEKEIGQDNASSKYVVADLNTRWVQLWKDGRAKPHRFFSDSDRGLLRCVWASQTSKRTSDWYDLPGSAEWWPDDPKYYVKHGFEWLTGEEGKYATALRMLGEKEPPKNWDTCMVHMSKEYDLLWDAFSNDSDFF